MQPWDRKLAFIGALALAGIAGVVLRAVFPGANVRIAHAPAAAEPESESARPTARAASLRELREWLQAADAGERGLESSAARDAWLARLAELAPLEALRLARGRRASEEELRRDLALVFKSWIRKDPEAAGQWLAGALDAALQAELAPTAAQALEMIDPAAAAGFLVRLSRGVVDDELFAGVLSRWQQVEFDATLAWTQSLPPGEAKSRALLHLSSRWVERDPWGAARYIETVAAADTPLLSVFASRWAANDPEGAAQWALQIGDGAQRAQVVASLTATWAETASLDATAFAAAISDPHVQSAAIVSAISGWARQDPRAATEWGASLPAGALREQTLTQALFAWGQRDAASAAEWLLALPDGRERDVALSAFSGSIGERHPSVALRLAESIDTEALRIQRIETVGQRWLAREPEAAASALSASSAPPEIVARLLRR